MQDKGAMKVNCYTICSSKPICTKRAAEVLNSSDCGKFQLALEYRAAPGHGFRYRFSCSEHWGPYDFDERMEAEYRLRRCFIERVAPLGLNARLMFSGPDELYKLKIEPGGYLKMEGPFDNLPQHGRFIPRNFRYTLNKWERKESHTFFMYDWADRWVGNYRVSLGSQGHWFSIDPYFMEVELKPGFSLEERMQKWPKAKNGTVLFPSSEA